ncbi:MAG: hypothetical protein WDW36_009067 [Sanguina aurantia]
MTRQHRISENARSEIAASIRSSYSDVGSWTHAGKLPVVYHERYNISFGGMEKLHPFDSCKFRKVLANLVTAGVITAAQTVAPVEASMQLLRDVHDAEYVRQVHESNWRIVQVTELVPLLLVPNSLLQWRVVTPLKLHVAGTVLAAGLAMQHGWAINLGGGMHHASSTEGMGWCPFDDIMLAVRRLRAASGGAVKTVMLIDLDAHQGNGVQRDKLFFGDGDLFIVDMYNGRAFPRDERAKAAIDVNVELNPGVGGPAYLAELDKALAAATAGCPSPDLIVYNAGTDVLRGDPLGRLGLSRDDVIARDQRVWEYASQRCCCPIVMTLSGGYTKDSASVISDSIANLFREFGLSGPAGT